MAHGLTHLSERRGLQRLFWFGVCLGTYVCTLCLIATMGRNFVDPSNLKTQIAVQMVSRIAMDGGNYYLPATFPRYVLCAGNLSMDLKDYENITIEYRVAATSGRQKNGVTITQKLPPLRPTVLSLRSNIFYSSPFQHYGMCSKLQIDATRITINWNNAPEPLILFFSSHLSNNLPVMEN